MTKAQQKIIQLLKEIKFICDENNLEFFLTGSYALRGFRSGKFESESPTLEIGMLYKDIIKLKKVIDEENQDNRCMESLYSNSKLRANIFRYVDRDTLYWRLNNPLKIKENGIAISIIPIYSQNVEERFSINKYIYYYWINRKFRKGKLLKKLPKRISRKYESLIRILMLNSLEKLEKHAKLSDNLHYRKNSNLKKVDLPSNVYLEPQTVVFEEVECKIPRNYDLYFNTTLGSEWETKIYNSKEINKNIIIDSEYSYAEYRKALKENSVSGDITKYVKKLNKIRRPLRKYSNFIKSQWEIVRKSFEDIN